MPYDCRESEDNFGQGTSEPLPKQPNKDYPMRYSVWEFRAVKGNQWTTWERHGPFESEYWLIARLWVMWKLFILARYGVISELRMIDNATSDHHVWWS